MDYREFGRWLRRYRERHNLTQADIAERCGIGNATVSYVETGASRPDVQTVVRVASGLGEDVQPLLVLAGYPVATMPPASTALQTLQARIAAEPALRHLVDRLADLPPDRIQVLAAVLEAIQHQSTVG